MSGRHLPHVAVPGRPRSGRSSRRAIILLVGLAATGRAAFAAGNAVTVTTLSDDVTPGDGRCSLREAIGNINAQDETTDKDCATGLGSGTVDFSVSGTVSIKLGPLSIGGSEASLTIEGGNTITVDGGGSKQIFDVHTLVYLNNLTISNGFATNGGAATAASALRVTNCSFVGNKASGLGGAIYMTGGASVQLTNSIFDSNVANQSGGAIYDAADKGQLIITNTTFNSNHADKRNVHPHAAPLTDRLLHSHPERNAEQHTKPHSGKHAIGDTTSDTDAHTSAMSIDPFVAETSRAERRV